MASPMAGVVHDMSFQVLNLQGARWRRLESGELEEPDTSAQPIRDPVPV